MPGLGGFALAGAAQGFGDGLVNEAKRRQEAALMNLRRQWDIEDMNRRESYQDRVRSEDRAYSENREKADRDRKNQKIEDRAGVYASLYGTAGNEGFSDPAPELDPSKIEPLPGFESSNLNGKIRDKPLDPQYVAVMSKVVRSLGPEYDVQVTSAGQAPKGSGGKRTGSSRHDVDDSGNAHTSDFVLTKNGQTIKPEDDPVLYERLFETAAPFFPGIGHYDGFVHVGGGKPAFWGPDKTSKSADKNFRKAYDRGRSVSPQDAWRILSDPETPESVRDDIRAGLAATGQADPRIAKSASKGLSGEEWIGNDDGTETLYGRVAGTGQMKPYVKQDGTPITRPKDTSNFKVSASLDTRLQRRFKNPRDGETDYQVVDAVRGEVIRLMKEEGLSETDAEQKALQGMIFEETKGGSGGFLGFGATEETTTRNKQGKGEFTGEFDYGGTQDTPKPPPGDPATPRMPQRSGQNGQNGQNGQTIPPAPRDPSSRKNGQVYMAPDGRKVKWLGDKWEVVNG